MKKLGLFLIFYSVIVLAPAQDTDVALERLLDFAHSTRDYLEGYSISTGTNDFNYHSFRSDITDCLLTRTTDGQMEIKWHTSPIPEQMKGDGVGFLWIAAFDITSSTNNFDLYLNGVKRFTIQTGNVFDWMLEGEDGGTLRFFTVEKDHHGDAHGYMALWAPESWLLPVKSQEISIKGEAAGSNPWIIVYKATDAASHLQNSIQYDKWLKLTATIEDPDDQTMKVTVRTPAYFKGDTLQYESGSLRGIVIPELVDGSGTGNFDLPADAVGKPLKISDKHSDLVITDALGDTGSSTILLRKAILQVSQEKPDSRNFTLEARRMYRPKTTTSLEALVQSRLSDGKIFLMNSSHQDIAWMDSPEKCVLERDTMLLSPLFELASSNPDYRFDVEDALMLREYIQRHPDQKSLVRDMLNEGRISCGSTFIQPYEEMYSGESLARQFYFGAKWLKNEFNYKANIYWNVDVPGRTLQMPQIMKKAGTDYLMMSRFEKGFYNWYSPDGSFITAYSPGHYADAFRPLQKDFFDAARYISTDALYWEQYFDEKSVNTAIPVLSDWDMSPAVNYSPFIEQWEAIQEIQDADGNFKSISLPQFSIASTPEFFDALKVGGLENLPAIKGERPAVWLYIHGPSHQKALRASRDGDILLTQAEKFATANAWIEGHFKDYPQRALNEAWEAKIYPDHGWGGKNGHITDNFFLQKYLKARDMGQHILDNTLKDIASKVKTREKKGIPVVVFNSLNWLRTDVANARLSFNPGEARYIVLKDASGRTLPTQIVEKDLFPDGSFKSVSIRFIAEDIPSIGYKTYYCSPLDPSENLQEEYPTAFESEFYRIKLSNGGIESIYDRELELELIDPSKFKGGEVFTMRSIGNGAGEFAEIQQPDMEGFDRTGHYTTTWKLSENGPVYISYAMRQPIRNAVVEQEIILYRNLKKIDFNTKVLNWEGLLFREYRMAMPLNMQGGQVVYEVPYGVLEVGKDEMEGDAGERYTQSCKATRPRGIQNWIGAYDENHCVILSSSVVAADYVDPTKNPVSGIILQPILFASRQSCHGEGNDYLQTGDHSFTFSLFSTRPDWRNGYRTGIQANERLLTVTAPRRYEGANLPEEKSFFSIEANNVMVSTVKKAEDNQNTVFRLVEMEGKDTETTLQTTFPMHRISSASLIEIPLQPVDTNPAPMLNVGHHAIETYIME